MAELNNEASKLPDPLPPWYQKDAGEEVVTPEARYVLEHYSGLEPDEVVPHVFNFRDRAFAVSPYACVGQFKFLTYRFETLHYWPYFLDKLRLAGTMLDVGCGLGQELRFLATRYPEEVTQSNLYGFDHEPLLLDLGYELFRDRNHCKINYFGADLLKESTRLDDLRDRIDLIQCAQVLQMFDYDDLFNVAARLVSLTRPQPGSMIAGHNLGSRNPGSYDLPMANGTTGKGYRNSTESMKEFWKAVGNKTGTQWEVDCIEVRSRAIEQNKHVDFVKNDPGIIMLQFSAKRL